MYNFTHNVCIIYFNIVYYIIALKQLLLLFLSLCLFIISYRCPFAFLRISNPGGVSTDYKIGYVTHSDPDENGWYQISGKLLMIVSYYINNIMYNDIIVMLFVQFFLLLNKPSIYY